jgi:hypothetical protein
LTGRHPDGCGVAKVGETTSCGRELSDLPACIGSYLGIGAMLLIGKFGAVGGRLFVHVTGRRVIPGVGRPTTGNLSVLTIGIIIGGDQVTVGKGDQVTVDGVTK